MLRESTVVLKQKSGGRLTGSANATVSYRMNIRVVQIWGFLLAVLGWIFVACTLAMEFWKISALGGSGGSNIIKVAWYWSSLWKSCYTDSTAVTNCLDFPVFWSVEDNIQIVRGLLMGALCLGMLAFVLTLVGMDCTYIGGKEQKKKKILISGGLCHIISGVLSFAGYVVYATDVSAEYFNPHFEGLKFNLGTPLFLGWVGSVFEVAGGILHCVSVRKPSTKSSTKVTADPECKGPTDGDPKHGKTSPRSQPSKLTSKSKVPTMGETASLSDLSDISDITAPSDVTSALGSSISSRSKRTGSQRNKRSYV